MKTIIIDGVEYNLTPKVAFREGDWVIDKQDIVHQIANVIENVTYHTYGYDIVGGGYFNDNTEGVRLWTIKDAKDGDVLKEDSCIFIIERMKPNGTAIVHCCLFDDGDFDLGSTLGFDVDNTYPATKEQRDTLEKAMADAGYTFDFEKKELKKIEKPAEWSEEDETVLNNLIYALSNDKIGNDRDEYVGWLKSLKGRVQPKQEWSEKDKYMLNNVIDTLKPLSQTTHSGYAINSMVNWLKSLRPQNTWKPSEEQMNNK